MDKQQCKTILLYTFELEFHKYKPQEAKVIILDLTHLLHEESSVTECLHEDFEDEVEVSYVLGLIVYQLSEMLVIGH